MSSIDVRWALIGWTPIFFVAFLLKSSSRKRILFLFRKMPSFLPSNKMYSFVQRNAIFLHFKLLIVACFERDFFFSIKHPLELGSLHLGWCMPLIHCFLRGWTLFVYHCVWRVVASEFSHILPHFCRKLRLIWVALLNHKRTEIYRAKYKNGRGGW